LRAAWGNPDGERIVADGRNWRITYYIERNYYDFTIDSATDEIVFIWIDGGY